jgi:predicted RNase H-like HicB family nuclease
MNKMLNFNILLNSGNYNMLRNFTAKYTKIPSGYMGQVIEWPEIITEGDTFEECRVMIQDAIHEMIRAYRQQEKELPFGRAIFEQIPVEI